jgi:two-component system, OmpR family, sensor histidine kinase KdpD
MLFPIRRCKHRSQCGEEWLWRRFLKPRQPAISTFGELGEYNTSGGRREFVSSRPIRVILSLAILAAITLAARKLISVNATTVGFAYLLLVLVVASTWGFIEASILSIAATLTFNFFFLPPVGNFTIADPQNWIALFTFLTTSLIASRLSTKARRRALDAIERQQDIERLYAFSRAILLIEGPEPFPGELIRKLSEIFQLDLAVLYDRRTGDFHKAGPIELQGLEDPLREAALSGITRSDDHCTLTAIRLGSEPIASLAIQGSQITDSVLQGIANLVAIGLERARAQGLAHEIEAAKRSEQLRTTLIDALAHEFKTPLTSIRATTTLLLDSPDQAKESRMELLKIADEEAQRLGYLIDDTVAMARLDTGRIKVNLELSNLTEIVDEVIHSLRSEIQGRSLEVVQEQAAPVSALDRRLIKLALKQLVDNALKYSLPGTPLKIRLRQDHGSVVVEVANQGKGIPAQELSRIFERFYRSPSVQNQIPGSGLGLSIAQSIAHAHNGNLTVTSNPGETTFRLILPAFSKGEQFERGTNFSN